MLKSKNVTFKKGNFAYCNNSIIYIPQRMHKPRITVFSLSVQFHYIIILRISQILSVSDVKYLVGYFFDIHYIYLYTIYQLFKT